MLSGWPPGAEGGKRGGGSLSNTARCHWSAIGRATVTRHCQRPNQSLSSSVSVIHWQFAHSRARQTTLRWRATVQNPGNWVVCDVGVGMGGSLSQVARYDARRHHRNFLFLPSSTTETTWLESRWHHRDNPTDWCVALLCNRGGRGLLDEIPNTRLYNSIFVQPPGEWASRR